MRKLRLQKLKLCKTAFAYLKVFCQTFFQKSWQVWTASTNKEYSFKTLKPFYSNFKNNIITLRP